METHADSATADAALGRRILRLSDRGALATLLRGGTPAGPAGRPYASLTLVASDLDGSPILLLSDLADHSRNIAAGPAVSLLLAPAMGAAEPLGQPRLSLLAAAESDGTPRLKERFLDRHPQAKTYAGFGDFRCYRLRPAHGHLVAGFGRIGWIEGSRLLLEVANPDELAGELRDLVRALNVDSPDLVQALGGAAGGAGLPWQLTGIDPEGCDFRAGERTARLDFPTLLSDLPSVAAQILFWRRRLPT
jgi:heme oxygenase (biliverdin-IX-beta and delta-forming)